MTSPGSPSRRTTRLRAQLAPLTLSDLFAGNSQMIVYHFMFDMDDEEGCEHCSFWADNFNGIDAIWDNAT